MRIAPLGSFLLASTLLVLGCPSDKSDDTSLDTDADADATATNGSDQPLKNVVITSAIRK